MASIHRGATLLVYYDVAVLTLKCDRAQQLSLHVLAADDTHLCLHHLDHFEAVAVHAVQFPILHTFGFILGSPDERFPCFFVGHQVAYASIAMTSSI